MEGFTKQLKQKICVTMKLDNLKLQPENMTYSYVSHSGFVCTACVSPSLAYQLTCCVFDMLRLARAAQGGACIIVSEAGVALRGLISVS